MFFVHARVAGGWGARMMLKFRVLIVLIACEMCQQVANGADNGERPFLRIVAPKFLCAGDKSATNQSESSDSGSSNALTIALQTSEGQKLRFQIKVDFELIDVGFVSQKHTLSIWRNIRNLQKKFYSQARDITERNQIEINANEVSIVIPRNTPKVGVARELVNLLWS